MLKNVGARENLPQKLRSKDKPITLGQLRQYSQEHPEFWWLNLSWGDQGGFDSGLYMEWSYLVDGKLYLVTDTWCPIYRHKTLKFRNVKIDRQIKNNRKKVPEILADWADLPDETELWMAIRSPRNNVFSRLGEHNILPIESVGPSTYVNGNEEYSYSLDDLNLDAYSRYSED